MNILVKLFSVSDLFHIYTVIRPKKEPSNPFYSGNHYLRLRDPSQPQTRLVTCSSDKDMFLDEFVWVSGSWEFQPGDDDLWSFPRYNGSLPDSECFPSSHPSYFVIPSCICVDIHSCCSCRVQ